MRFKRILLAFAGVSALTFSLASCGNNEEQPKADENQTKDSGTNENSGANENSGTNENSNTLTETTLYCVGDSTVCSFNDAYYIPRYGYGTQLDKYLDEKVTVNNLAMSGRSSKSFLSEGNYSTLTSSIKAGDY